jgi:DNA helicase II / ATP-dependent DNA helicase PcrA
LASWSQLNDSQRAAALHDGGPAAVYAGPGSGKTRVVTLRAARLAERGANVLVTTFTNDATEEMRARIAPLLPKRSPGSTHATTMHALCLSILRGEGRKFQLLTDEGQRRGLAEAALAMELDGGVAGFLTRTSYLKNTGETATAYKHDGSSEDREFASVWRSYEKAKAERGLAEFDDLLTETVALLSKDEAVRAKWAGKFTHILVDECQDMNRPQYAVALALGRDHHNVMLVGDPDQSLYAFRGADTDTFRQFAKHPTTKIYELRENYRSTRSIITFADGLIRQEENRKPLAFVPTRAEGVPVRWQRYADADTEALAIADEILRLAEKGARYADMAVLYRVNAQSEALERNFAALEIPYIPRQSGDFYARKEVAGILAYLEFFASYADEWLLAFLNLPNRRLGRSVGAEMRRVAKIRGKTIWESLPDFTAPDLKSHRAVRQMLRELQHVEERLPRVQSAGEAVKLIRQTMEFDNWLRVEELDARDNDRIQNLEQMQDAASHYRTIEDYVKAIRKVREEAERRKAEAKKRKQELNAVTLCTGHAAKGLEWRYVFGVGWNEGLLPHRKSEDVSEERRIAYVIATRAKDYLCVSSLQNWNSATVEPSRFLTGVSVALSDAASAHEPVVEAIEEEALGGLFVG